MHKKLWMALVVGVTSILISGCIPLAVGVGAGAVIVTDEIIEDERGGDGLL